MLVVGSTRSGGTCKTDLVAWIAARHPDLALLAHPTGDEDAMLRASFPGRVFAHRDLLRAWEAARQAGFAAAVADGGLQDPALDGCPALCLELSDAPLRPSDLLPLGRYRELSPTPRARLHRILVDRDLAARIHAGAIPPPGTEIVAATSIARPEPFFQELERNGLVVRETLAFGDHRIFPRRAVDGALARNPGTVWLITSKDAARGELARLPPGSMAVERRLEPSMEVARIVDEAARSLIESPPADGRRENMVGSIHCP